MSRIVYGSGSAIRGSRPALSEFPALKHFFTATSGAGVYPLLDLKGGLELQTHEWASASDGVGIKTTYANDAVSHNLTLKTGSWNLTNKRTLAVVCADVGGSLFAFGIGDSTPNGEELLIGKSFYIFGATSQSQFPAGPSVSSPAGTLVDATKPAILGGTFTPGGNVVGLYTNTNGVYAEQTPIDASPIETLPVWPTTYSLPSAVSCDAFYALAIFQFDTAFPADMAAAMEFHLREWRVGNFDIFPNWAGRN